MARNKHAGTANTQPTGSGNVSPTAEKLKTVIIVSMDEDGKIFTAKPNGVSEREYMLAMLALIQEANDTLPEYAPQDITAVHLAC